jgi:hypothetical protein
LCGALKAGPGKFPLGTLAMYGPDDQTTTKIVARIVTDEGAEPIVEKWVGMNVKDDLKVAQAIAAFFVQHQVSKIDVSEGNVGCPHEEDEEFPQGQDCPFCPWWAGKQGQVATG